MSINAAQKGRETGVANRSNGLTEKMKKFCRAYFANGGNGTEAYLEAYDTTNRVTASRESHDLLKRKDINEYIRTLNIPQENKAISEREKKRQWLWHMIETAESENARLMAMNILNKMDSEYVNINRNIEDTNADIISLDNDTLSKLVGSA